MRNALIAAALAVLAAAGASAEDAGRGRLLAERWCVECHVIGPDAAGGDVGPTFGSVASRPGQNAGAIRAWLMQPHAPMPDPGLSPAEFDDLASYIISLRKE